MKEFAYAVRTVTLPSGTVLEIAHAVEVGTIITACRTLAEPIPGSRWADSDPDGRCEACEARVSAQLAAPADPVVEPPAPQAEPAPAPVPARPPARLPQAEAPVEPTPGPEPTSEEPRGPSFTDRARAAGDRASALWQGLDPRARIGLLVGVLVLVVAVFFLALSGGDEVKPDQNSPTYKNGYMYGRDLMHPTTSDIAHQCQLGDVENPGSIESKNFIAGCQAGYAARRP